MEDFGGGTTMDIVELVNRPVAMQGRAKDFKFSRSGMVDRWSQGHADATAALTAAPWREPMPEGVGADL